jgi:hypothetical protein
MNRKHTTFLPSLAMAVLFGLLTPVSTAWAQAPGQAPTQTPGQTQGQAPRQGQGMGQGQPQGTIGPGLRNAAQTPVKSDTTRNLASHFTQATTTPIAPDAKGFIRRWLILEPVKKNITSNRNYTDSYLRNEFSITNFNPDFTVIPKKGSTVTIDNQQLKWYALDSKLFNFKLFSFSYAINKPQYGVLFWGVTVINCPEEIKNVRMVAGINSAGMLWFNGKEAIMMSSDRDMVMDDAASPRVTLKKGKNVIRIGVINGPGMSDFCVRFLDEKLQPVKNFTISCE